MMNRSLHLGYTLAKLPSFPPRTHTQTSLIFSTPSGTQIALPSGEKKWWENYFPAPVHITKNVFKVTYLLWRFFARKRKSFDSAFSTTNDSPRTSARGDWCEREVNSLDNTIPFFIFCFCFFWK